MRSAPSRWSTSNRNADSGTDGSPSARVRLSVAARPALAGGPRGRVLKAYGRPSGRSAISSPSNTAVRTGSADIAVTTSGSRPVISSSVRVNSRTLPPER